MKHPASSIVSLFHAARAARLALLFLIAPGSSLLASASAASAVAVTAVQPTRVADLVMLDHGFDASLRQGMVCRISRGAAEVAEVLLVEVRPTCSAALITRLAPQQSIRSGDLATVKILKT